METSLKTGFAQIFSCCPKNLSCPKFGGAAAPLAPPARTPMGSCLPGGNITLTACFRHCGESGTTVDWTHLSGLFSMFRDWEFSFSNYLLNSQLQRVELGSTCA